MTVIAIGNRKGGVGKTTATLGLASELARVGKRVLVIDMDLQANATLTLGADSAENTIYDVIAVRESERIPLQDAIVPTAWPGIDCVPGHESIANLDQATDGALAGHRLRTAIEKSGVKDVYDHIFIDTPPSVSTCTVSALLAADEVIAVVAPEPWGTGGLDKFLSLVDSVREIHKGDLRLRGVLVNGVKNRTKEHQFRIEEIRDNLEDASLLLEPFIPHRIAATEMPSEEQPFYMLPSGGAQILSSLFAEHAAALAIGD